MGRRLKIGDSFRNDKTGQLIFGNILQGIDNVLNNDCVYPEVYSRKKFSVQLL